MSLRTALTSLCALSCALAVPAAAQAQAAEPPMRDVLVVSNNWAGTADIVDQRSLKRIKRLNVIPDREQRIAEIVADPTRKFYFDNIRTLIGEGHDQYVDDGFVSKDGRSVYFSRPSFADVIALDIRTGAIRWRVRVDGYRADHMALSPDGRRLLVSASTARTVDVIDPRRGRIVGRFPTGDSPHENNYSRDGKLIFQASIGTVYTDADAPSEDASKGERIFEVVDARTLKVRKRIDMGAKMAEFGVQANGAVRPMAISPDERFVYMQLSFLHGFVEYDLRTDSVKRVAALPVPADVRRLPRKDYLLDSAHHGLAMNPQGTKLCVAGTMDRYAAIVSRSTLKPQRVVEVGEVPYWAASGTDGRHCFVSVAGEDRVAVIDWSTAREVESIRVGDHPQRMRTGRAREASLRGSR